jgi:hypothetical protein
VIAEQVIEYLKAFPQPQAIHCNKKGKLTVGGNLNHCLVFFPTPVPLQ